VRLLGPAITKAAICFSPVKKLEAEGKCSARSDQPLSDKHMNSSTSALRQIGRTAIILAASGGFNQIPVRGGRKRPWRKCPSACSKLAQRAYWAGEEVS
jgi:hypothetical protein